MDELHQVIDQIRKLLTTKAPVLIAIDGYGGAGKSTLARDVQKEFPGASIITFDDFALFQGGADRKRLLEQVLIPLFEGKTAHYRRFDFQKKSFAEWKDVEPKGLVIFEGVSINGDDFHPYYDLRIWIDCPLNLATKRGMERDRNINKMDNDKLWLEVWSKEDEEYAKTEPWKRADVVIKARGV